MLRIVCSTFALPAVAMLLAAVPAGAAQAKPTQGKTAAQPQTHAAGTRAATADASRIVNINTASASEFESLPGIGAKMAARIVEYRQKNGPFKKVEELMNVRGLGEKNFLKLKAQLTVGAAKAADRTQQQ
jgi:comEA protein